jgi:hypothetical protein
MDASRPECEPLMVLKFFLKLLRYLATILSFGALHTKPSRRVVESPRRIDNCLIETLMLLNNILGEPLNWLSIILGDSTNLREVLTVPDNKSRNIPEVILVRRWAVRVLGIWREGVGWVKGGANGVSLQAT